MVAPLWIDFSRFQKVWVWTILVDPFGVDFILFQSVWVWDWTILVGPFGVDFILVQKAWVWVWTILVGPCWVDCLLTTFWVWTVLVVNKQFKHKKKANHVRSQGPSLKLNLFQVIMSRTRNGPAGVKRTPRGNGVGTRSPQNYGFSSSFLLTHQLTVFLPGLPRTLRARTVRERPKSVRPGSETELEDIAQLPMQDGALGWFPFTLLAVHGDF